MAFNSQHHITFGALLQLWGFPEEEAQMIGYQLAQVDNGIQDDLIRLITLAYKKEKSLVVDCTAFSISTKRSPHPSNRSQRTLIIFRVDPPAGFQICH